MRIGKDIESVVLARAVRWHAEHRVMLNGQRTVVFSPADDARRMRETRVEPPGGASASRAGAYASTYGTSPNADAPAPEMRDDGDNASTLRLRNA